MREEKRTQTMRPGCWESCVLLVVSGCSLDSPVEGDLGRGEKPGEEAKSTDCSSFICSTFGVTSFPWRQNRFVALICYREDTRFPFAKKKKIASMWQLHFQSPSMATIITFPSLPLMIIILPLSPYLQYVLGRQWQEDWLYYKEFPRSRPRGLSYGSYGVGDGSTQGWGWHRRGL